MPGPLKLLLAALGLAVTAGLVGCSSSGSSGSGLNAGSGCKSYLTANTADQDEAVKKIAVAQNDSTVLTPLGRPNVDYYCGSNDTLTLGQAIADAGGTAKSSTATPAAGASVAAGGPSSVAGPGNAAAAAARAKYPNQYSIVQQLGPVVCRKLVANPTDQPTNIRALSAMTGVSVADVTTIVALDSTSGPDLAAGRVIDATTFAALLNDPTDTAAAARAQTEIVSGLGLTPSDAAARVAGLRAIPVSQLVLVQQDGPKIVAAQSSLVSMLSQVSAAYLTLLGC